MLMFEECLKSIFFFTKFKPLLPHVTVCVHVHLLESVVG